MSQNSSDPNESSQKASRKKEVSKRRREIFTISALSILFIILAWFEFRIFLTAKELPFVYSIFFFGLVNFNLTLLLFILFLIFRNLFKAFIEKKRGVGGSSLKSRLIMSFFIFSAVPTLLMFFVSVVYINSSFDKWFSEKISSVMRDALEVTQHYYSETKKYNFFAADRIASQVQKIETNGQIRWVLLQGLKNHRLDSVEYYGHDLKKRIHVQSNDSLEEFPALETKFLEKGMERNIESSVVEERPTGNIIRTMVPLKNKKAVIVTSKFISISLMQRMNTVSTVYEELKGTRVKYPLKSIYIVILVLMALVILFCATWFGFHMAKHLSRALQQLSRATERIAKGDYSPVESEFVETEVQSLAESFNTMAEQLRLSQDEVQSANNSLKSTLEALDERSRYIQVVLSNVSTGVISLDIDDSIRTINEKAASLFGVRIQNYIGTKLTDVIGDKYFRFYRQMYINMQKYNISKMSRQLTIKIKDIEFPALLTISRLVDNQGTELGRVVGFDDITDVINSQKAEAWQEVARRIAHEIKNPLTPIKLSAQRLQKKFSEEIKDQAFHDGTRMIIEQTDNIKKLVNEFSQYARLPKLNLEIQCMNSLLEGLLNMYKQSYPKVTFITELDSSLEPFLFDGEQLKRVYINLLENAIKAGEKIEKLTISVRTEFEPVAQVVRVQFYDNGPGVSKEILSKLFQPYFSNTPGGSGLGLAIVKKTINDHGGVIKACLNTAGSLDFLISLPYKRKVEDSNERYHEQS